MLSYFKCILVAGIFGTVLSLPVYADERIDEMFRSYSRTDAPGASVMVVKNGVVMHSKGYGLANQEEKQPATPLTNYRLASLTKQFTAMAVMILKEAGKISYDMSVTDILPAFPTYGKSITVRHLLNHTSGLLDYEDLIPTSQKEQLKDRDVLAILSKQNHTYFTPGTSYRYSNSGYALLAVLVEEVSGQGFSGFLTEHIFMPLAMHDSVAFEEGVHHVSNRAYGYTYNGATFTRTDQSLTSAVLGDGGVYTSLTDYVKWDAALYGENLVRAETLKEAFTPGRLRDGSLTNYGFGWQVDTYRGGKRVSHTGSTIGFRTAVQRFPDKQLTVLVFINREGATPWDLAARVADLYW